MRTGASVYERLKDGLAHISSRVGSLLKGIVKLSWCTFAPFGSSTAHFEAIMLFFSVDRLYAST